MDIRHYKFKKVNIVYGYFYFISCIGYLALRMHLPITLGYAPHDDTYFINTAQNLLHGTWFGGYNHMTLIKGPAYTFFLAANRFLGLPVTFSSALLHMGACGFLIWSLARFRIHNLVLCSCFILILFEPSLITTRVYRDDFYNSIILVFIAQALYFLSAPFNKKSSLFFGFTFAALYMTREDFPWLIPGILALAFLALWYNNVFPISNSTIKEKGMSLLISIATFSFIILLISTVNFAKYNYFGTNDFNATGFKAAHAALNSVVLGSPIPHLPVPENTRKLIYENSPSFKELEEYFEGNGKIWTSFGAQFYPWTKGDYAAGWFSWALRDAVASKGYYKNGLCAEDFYRKIADEIKHGQVKKLLPKRFILTAFTPALENLDIKVLEKSLKEAFELMMYRFPFDCRTPSSSLNYFELNKTLNFLGNPKIVKNDENVLLSGWFFNPSDEEQWVELRKKNDDMQFSQKIERQTSPDVAETVNKKANKNRFILSLTNSANLVLKALPATNTMSKENSFEIQSLKSKKGKVSNLGPGLLVIDNYEESENYDNPYQIKNKIIYIYKIITPFVVITSLLGSIVFILYFTIKRKQLPIMIAISIIFLLFYFFRILLCIAVDATSFPCLLPHYFACVFVFPFLSFFCQLSEAFKTNLICKYGK